MRRAVLTGARVVLLAGPVVLAFRTGGYLDAARLWAALGAWGLVVVALLGLGRRLPGGRPAALALGGLAGLALWTGISIAWAPIGGTAYDATQIAVLYAGALLAAAVLLLGADGALRWVEPAVGGGALVVVGYGLSERLLPGVLTFARSQSALGRLEQPLTYWNALGAVAALGLVLGARLGGDARRPVTLRVAAGAAAAPLALGLSLTVSRGALFAAAAGLLALVVAARRREQLAAALLVAAVGAATALACSGLDAVATLAGSASTRESEGLAALAITLAGAAAGGAGALVLQRRLAGGPLGLPRGAGWLASAVILAGFVTAVAVGSGDASRRPLTPGASRYASFESNRYEYWRVAARSFEREPLRGVGAEGWAVDWRRERTVAEGAADAHSLYVQTAAELGLIGLALLAAAFAGVALSARAALRLDAAAAAGPVAGCVVWATHVALDWDWQMPAATLPALVLAGALVALGATATAS